MRKLLLLILLVSGAVRAECHTLVNNDDVVSIQCPTKQGWYVITAMKKYSTASTVTIEDKTHHVHLWTDK